MSISQKILTFFLSASFLVSSIGIPVNRHFCMNRLMDVKFFIEARKCKNEMMMDKTSCPSNPVKDNSNKGCCKDTHEIIKIDNAQNHIQKVELSKLMPDYISICHFPVTIIDLMPVTIHKIAYHKPPPIIKPSKQVEFHSFLI